MPTALPPYAAVLRTLREQCGCTQVALERALGLCRGSVSKYEQGERTLSRRRLERLVSPLGAGPEEIDRELAALERLPQVKPAAETPATPTPAERRAAEEVAALVRARTLARLVEGRIARERAEAEGLCAELLGQPSEGRRALVLAVARYQTWAVSERLCALSEQAAPGGAGRARELADLALLAAERAPDPEPWKHRLVSDAWAYVANSRRVAGELGEAERAFVRSDQLWQAGEAAPPAPLDPARRLDLKASLRRYQGRLAEALDLLDQALALATTKGARARLLLKRAATLEYMERYEAALENLAAAAPWVEAEGGLRLRCVLRFNRIVNLGHLEKFAEAERELESFRPLAFEAGEDLDLLRLRWLEARVAGGLGRKAEAAAGLSAVWQGFAGRKIPFDAALAALEVAALELERGRSREVRDLARRAAPVFAVQRIPRKLLASVRLFWAAAEREEATAEVARRLLRELERARPAHGNQG